MLWILLAKKEAMLCAIPCCSAGYIPVMMSTSYDVYLTAHCVRGNALTHKEIIITILHKCYCKEFNVYVELDIWDGRWSGDDDSWCKSVLAWFVPTKSSLALSIATFGCRLHTTQHIVKYPPLSNLECQKTLFARSPIQTGWLIHDCTGHTHRSEELYQQGVIKTSIVLQYHDLDCALTNIGTKKKLW